MSPETAFLLLIVSGIVIAGFIVFSIYFFYKCLEFVIRAIKLYERIIEREDTIISIMRDILKAIPREAVLTPAGSAKSKSGTTRPAGAWRDPDDALDPSDEPLPGQLPITFCKICHQKFRMLPDTDHVRPVCPDCQTG
jgi:hypothetical protein